MNKRKWLSILLCIVLALSMLPVATSAAEDTGDFYLTAVTGDPNGFNNEGYANLFDGNTESKWCFNFSSSAYVIFKASEPVKLSKYSIATANDTAGNPGRNPVEWTLSGCMDYEDASTSWAVIDTVTNGGLPSENETYTDFILSENTPFYQYFKLEITKINSGRMMQISEIALKDYTLCDHQFKATGATIAPTCTEGGYDVYECSICHMQKNVPNGVPENGHSYENGICTVCRNWQVGDPVNYQDENGTEQTVVCEAAITAEYLSNNSNTLTSGWYLVAGTITTVDSRIAISGDVKLILVDGCELQANNGIQVQDTNALTIYGQTNGTGKLVASAARSYTGNAGIGGNGSTVHEGRANSCGSVTINGGIIEAAGSSCGAGIGGGGCTAMDGYAGSGGNITINGGIVKATGDYNAAGIGSGGYWDCGWPGGSGSFSTGTNSKSVIYANSISDQSGKTAGTWSGVIFEGNNTSGTVYGNTTLPTDLTIESGQTLTIPSGTSLTVPAGVTLTNNGTIIIEDGGTLINNGTIINNINNGKITIKGTYTGNAPKYSTVYLDADGIEKTAICDAILTADNIGEYTTINEGWYVVHGTVTQNNRITVSGTVNLILADGCTLAASNGITVQGSNSLTIYAQSTDESTMGKLTATGGFFQAGIGGDEFGTGGNITINGGAVTATGGFNGGAGIGGGDGGSGGNITINGGTITAVGSNAGGAGIGGGFGQSGGTITINGGAVTATGGSGGAGIGDGYSGSGGTFSTDTNGKAVIFASTISDQSGNAEDAANPWNGVIFEGNDGTVYGTSVTPTEDFTIESGKSLLIPTGSTLTISGITAVNNGSVYVDGALTGTFSGTGNVYYRLTVVNASANGDLTNYNSKTYSQAGSGITLTPNTPLGQSFGEWISTPTVTVSDSNTFTMPYSALTITAQYINTPTYTVTIPATVELGGTATVTADGVSVADGSQLVVKLSGTSGVNNAFTLSNGGSDTLTYRVTKDSKDGTAISVNGSVLTVAGGIADNSGSEALYFTPATEPKYAGKYTGTVTFTVSVEAVSST